MKSPDYSQLDNFIRETLKIPEHNLTPVDWSELDVLLRHETKSIPLPNKKYLFMGVGAVILIAGIFFLVKFISSYKSSPEEKVITTDTISTIVPGVDSAVAQSVPVSIPYTIRTGRDTAEQEIDSAALVLQEKKADSLIADFKEKEKKKVSEEKISDKKEQKKTELPEVKAGKKTKISALAPTISDVELTPENILPPDTTGKNKIAEPKNIPSVTADSSKASSGKKTKKNKKGKSAADTSKVKPETLPAKTDSLK